ncbi:PREDICTED: armadillo repeat-containing protein 5 isoform X2 [Papilio xuthus]|uniref:Armadillo repeat-containing protein 5 isoform X2 n=1 Tax=Papilio xuthus TaxID=66420 RepID=A0AAJ7E6J2_PAPXU|nr:PREDICTED: armadillo repeat-containing protein 5 isoform X2 [Papilio xuthus]
MDKNYIEKIIEDLKSTSSTCIHDTLLKIKNNIICNDKGLKIFRDCGGLDNLLPLLRKPNERILNTALSVLGNCCMDETSSLMVGKLNIFGPLISILKTVYRDSILGRTCRLIGNLAQRHSNAKGLHEHGAVEVLVTLIENRDKNTSIATLTMAVRAIRQLWMVTDKREEMLSVNAVRCITVLLTVQCESAGIIESSNPTSDVEELKKSHEELINGILKCLGYFTTYTNPQCFEQIQGDGRGYKCLVALTKLFESTALKCLINLCYVPSCRPLLGTAGLVECLVGILQKLSDVAWWPEGSAKALALLSNDSVNRCRLRHCGGLPLLVSAARVNSYVLHALLQYYFDDSAFQILVNEGLISVLTDKLNDHLTTMDFEHKRIMKLIKVNRGQNGVKEKNNECSDLEELNIELLKVIGGIEDDDESRIDYDIPIAKRKKAMPEDTKHLKLIVEPSGQKRPYDLNWERKYNESVCKVLSQIPVSPDRSDTYPTSPYSDTNQSGLASPEYGPTRKRMRWDWSPESSVSAGEGSSASPYWADWSPQSSSCPTSPYSINEDSADSEISGRYSPVCSEPEIEDGGKLPGSELLALEVTRVDHDLDELDMGEDKSDDEETSREDANKFNVNSKIELSDISCVLVLLFRVSHGASYDTQQEIDPTDRIDLLAGHDCLNGLLNYLERCKSPLGNPARILKKVLSARCFMNILKHRFPLRLYNMTQYSKHPRNECLQCNQVCNLSLKLLARLTVLAESSYGIGEISYQLLKGSPDMKQTLSITLPYIVSTAKPLKKYFIDCNALNELLNIISESKEDNEISIMGLVKLANNVHIKDPKMLENRFKDKVSVSYDPILDNLLVDDIVTFELDDLSTVRANKLFLCQNSDVFSAMLMGCFKESGESCVRLKKASKSALEYLFTLLQCGLNNPKSDIIIFPMAEKLETSLETLLLADRFLFERLKDILSSGIVQFQLCAESAERIYVWSLGDGMGFLCVEAAAYLLTGEMSRMQRTRSFTNILSLKYKDQWLDDIKSMIMRQLVKC